jgi:nitrogen fixation/metabolism regulation signal transduction histidine kinase
VLILVVLVVLSVALGWLLASRLLRPVRVITAAAQDISASNLSRRLRVGRRDDEFTRLGETGPGAGRRRPPADGKPDRQPGRQRAPLQRSRRLGTERTQRSGGHGLGLAIVRAIADAHGAAVTTAARDSGGLDITVTFPEPARPAGSVLLATAGGARARSRRRWW